MPKIVSVQYLCNLCPKSKQAPIDQADVYTHRFLQGGRTYETFFCQAHGEAVIEGAEPITGFASDSSSTRTRKPREEAEQLVAKADIPACRSWLESKKLLPAGSRGRIKRELQEQWIAAGSPQLPA